MRTIKISINPKKHSAFYEYFHTNTADSKCMYNAASFYIRNTMTGIRKSPEERTHLETEALHDVFTAIQKANAESLERYDKKMAKYRMDGGMKHAVCAWKLTKKPERQFSYPTYHNWFLSYETLDAIFKYTNNPVYKRMNSQVNQKAIRRVTDAWKGYFESIKDYRRNPWKYTGKPRIPKYQKNEEYIAAFTNQTARLKECHGVYYIHFVNKKEFFKIGRIPGYGKYRYVKAEVKPEYGRYALLLTFDDNAKEVARPEKPERIIGIDVGVDNFLAVGNNFGATPFLIKGGALKSMNHTFNKKRAQLMSSLTKGWDSTGSAKNSRRLYVLSRNRDNFIRDFFYKCAWNICRFALRNHANVIVLGQNKRQKQGVCLGTRTNQNFVSIPFCRFQGILRAVTSKCGIYLIVREESYTSKASFLDMDDIPTYQDGNNLTYTFSGKRMHRGLYRSKNGDVINADINGACNIIRKEFPGAFKGKDITYLYQTTGVIKYQDLYGNACSVCTGKYNGKSHKAGISSGANHLYKKHRRMELLAAFR